MKIVKHFREAEKGEVLTWRQVPDSVERQAAQHVLERLTLLSKPVHVVVEVAITVLEPVDEKPWEPETNDNMIAQPSTPKGPQ